LKKSREIISCAEQLKAIQKELGASDEQALMSKISQKN